MRRFIFYVVIGGIGFLVDALLLSLATYVFSVDPYTARALSFPPAVLITWLLNRHLVFYSTADSKKTKAYEYGRYFSVQTVGALINFTVYVVFLALWPTLKPWPVIALAAGSAVALLFNYFAAKCWVFKPKH